MIKYPEGQGKKEKNMQKLLSIAWYEGVYFVFCGNMSALLCHQNIDRGQSLL